MFDTDPVDGSPRGAFATIACLSLLLLAGLVPFVGPATAHAGADQITLEASEDCTERTYCFEVTEGSLDDIDAGEEVQITLVNPESNDLQHNVYVAALSDASGDRETDGSAAQANTEDLAPGEEATFETFIPQGYDGVYLWCDFGVHEGQGMYIEVPFSDGAGTDSGDETNDSPATGTMALLLTVAALALTIRRDSR